MGNENSGYTSGAQYIDCDEYIDHSDVSVYIRRNSLSNMDRTLMQGVYTLLDQEPDWVWRNAQIRVYGEDVTVFFIAGGQDNVFVVNRNEDDEVSSSCRNKGLRLRLRDLVKSIWNSIRSGTKYVLGAVAGGSMKMLKG